MQLDIKKIADAADMIINGYAYTQEGKYIRMLNLNKPNHAAVIYDNKIGLFFDSLGNIDNDLSFLYIRCHQFRCTSDIWGRHSQNDHFCGFHAAFHVCSKIDILRDMYPRQYGSKFSRFFESIYFFLKSGPETNLMSIIAQKD